MTLDDIAPVDLPSGASSGGARKSLVNSQPPMPLYYITPVPLGGGGFAYGPGGMPLPPSRSVIGDLVKCSLIVLRSLVSFSYARILMQRQKNKVGEL
jgi:hypothetical protein